MAKGQEKQVEVEQVAAEVETKTEMAWLAVAGVKFTSGLKFGAQALAEKADAGDAVLRARGQFLRDVKVATDAHKQDKSLDVPATPEGGLKGYIAARVIPAIASARADHAKEVETLCKYAKARSWVASEFGAAAAGQTRNFEKPAHYAVMAELHKCSKRAVATDETRASVKLCITNAQRESAAAFRKALVAAGILDAKAGGKGKGKDDDKGKGKLVSELTGPELGAIVAGRQAGDIPAILNALVANADHAEALCVWVASRPNILKRAGALAEENAKTLAAAS